MLPRIVGEADAAALEVAVHDRGRLESVSTVRKAGTRELVPAAPSTLAIRRSLDLCASGSSRHALRTLLMGHRQMPNMLLDFLLAVRLPLAQRLLSFGVLVSSAVVCRHDPRAIARRQTRFGALRSHLAHEAGVWDSSRGSCRQMSSILDEQPLRGFLIQRAVATDAPAISAMFDAAYDGAYPFPSVTRPGLLALELEAPEILWLRAIDEAGRLCGVVRFRWDGVQRVGDAGCSMVVPACQGRGLGAALLRTGGRLLLDEKRVVDLIYGTARTTAAGFARMCAAAGYVATGLLPNAARIAHLEHLELEVCTTPRTLAHRRRPWIVAPFHQTFRLAAEALGLRSATVDRTPHAPAGALPPVSVDLDASGVAARFARDTAAGHVTERHAGFHCPTCSVRTDDGEAEVFLAHNPAAGTLRVVGQRQSTSDPNPYAMAATAAKRLGHSYVEALVGTVGTDAQWAAHAAGFRASGYVPAARLAARGWREDVVVVTRTSEGVDVAGAVLTLRAQHHLAAYLNHGLADETGIQTA